MRPVPDVLEGVKQDHRRDRLAGWKLGELPCQQVWVERQGVEIGFGLQQVGQACAASECADPFAGAPAERTREPVTWPIADPAVPGRRSASVTSDSADCICCGSARPNRAANLPE